MILLTKRKPVFMSVLLAAFMLGQSAASAAARDLRVYFIDVEGGQSTLFVTPTGQSLLIDTGWPDNDGRDADRILAATKSAGISKIDYVLLTHYHDDHSGASPGLETLFQLHYSEKGGADHNTAAQYIANPQGADQGNYFVLTANPKGSFTIYNSGTKQTRDYAAK